MSNYKYDTGLVQLPNGSYRSSGSSSSGFSSGFGPMAPMAPMAPSTFRDFGAMSRSPGFGSSFAQSSSCSSSVSTQTINGVTNTVKKFQVNGIDVSEADYNKACGQTGGKKKPAAKKPAVKKPAAKKPAAKKPAAKKK